MTYLKTSTVKYLIHLSVDFYYYIGTVSKNNIGAHKMRNAIRLSIFQYYDFLL